nr:hypothetical protein [Bifidobacterium aesculapii]
MSVEESKNESENVAADAYAFGDDSRGNDAATAASFATSGAGAPSAASDGSVTSDESVKTDTSVTSDESVKPAKPRKSPRSGKSGGVHDRRRALVMRGIVTPAIGLLAVAAVALGLLNATIWQPSRVITADAKVSGARYIVTDPNVLGLVDSDVRLDVDVNGGGDVCVASASSKDAAGWLSGAAYTRVTGMSDWATLSSEQVKGGKDDAADTSADTAAGESGDTADDAANTANTTDAAADVAFKDSDMWSSVKCGKGEASLKTTAADATDVAIVDLGKTTTADLSLTWTRRTLPDYATPMYFIGGLLAVLAVLTATVFAMPPHKRRKRVVESEPVNVEDEVSFGEAVAGSLGIRPSYAPKTKRSGGRRRRHAPGADTGTMAPVAAEAPVVVDPSARNLVADAEAANGESAPSVNDEATSVISPDELQAYFARLAQEVGDDTTAVNNDTDGANATDDAGTKGEETR